MRIVTPLVRELMMIDDRTNHPNGQCPVALMICGLDLSRVLKQMSTS